MTGNAPIKNKIKFYRKNRKILQQQMADDLGIERTYLSKLENQIFSPGPDLMKKICQYFNANIEDLFYL